MKQRREKAQVPTVDTEQSFEKAQDPSSHMAHREGPWRNYTRS